MNACGVESDVTALTHAIVLVIEVMETELNSGHSLEIERIRCVNTGAVECEVRDIVSNLQS